MRDNAYFKYDYIQELSTKENAILNVVMFEKSKATVRNVLKLTQAIYLRNNISHEVRHSILKMIKMLVGKELQFHCTNCNAALSESITKIELSKQSSVQCKDCSKMYMLSTKHPNYYRQCEC